MVWFDELRDRINDTYLWLISWDAAEAHRKATWRFLSEAEYKLGIMLVRRSRLVVGASSTAEAKRVLDRDPSLYDMLIARPRDEWHLTDEEISSGILFERTQGIESC